ncbi:T9SS type A sorting domain-containing protein [Aestuariibaculum sp. YM273]|uniref:T9SS type A sorting domain-containing protein n=1 Tax=Aestuariibaculum sp. YM273 TaxID=3070659 RepID=UPI0027DDAED0|nr:T9SS type A sorting domain-containing protein [Aestuariibaculum sp. YM273]WMI64114.1 T9SS type A sorting domain-containing protein [Aestuariibaculum sp. YM273]
MKKFYTRLTILIHLLFCFSLANAQIQQLGADIDGLTQGDELGYSASISESGSRIVVGAPYSDGGGNDSGQVRVFDNIGGVWTQVGQVLDGEANNERIGSTVSLNADGSILAIGAPSANGSRGLVRVYAFVAGSWIQVGNDLEGDVNGGAYGGAISLNAAGNFIAVGAWYTDDNGNNSGKVKVYSLSSGAWNQIGADLIGESAGDIFGFSLSLNGSGERLVVGAPNNAGGGVMRGHVRVFDYSGGSWVQHGNDIEGKNDNDSIGHSVDINEQGDIIVVGGNLSNEGFFPEIGVTRVYNVLGVVSQIGSDIRGENARDLSGSTVSINGSGNRISISAINNSGNGDGSGHVRVFDNIGGVWTQIGGDIDGESAGDKFGFSNVLSADGSHLVAGSPLNSTQTGQAKVFSIDAFPLAVCQDITVQLDASGTHTIVGADIDGGSSDFEGEVSLSVSPNTFSCNDVGTPVEVTLTVTDSAGQVDTCTATVTVEVGNIAITSAEPNDICFADASNSGMIHVVWQGDAKEVNVSSSTTTNSYTSGLENGELSIQNLEAGMYTIEIIGPCDQTVSTDVEVLQLDELAITGAYPNDICFGDAVNSGSIDLEWAGAAENIYVSFSGGNWSYDTGLESGELKILPLEAGTYHIEILGDCGETVSTDVEVQQLDELAITGAYPIDICFGEASNSGSIDLEWAGAAENIYVSFSGGNWSYDTGLESGELKILPLEAGTYHIEILGDCGETVSTDVEVQQLDELAITGAYPIDICFGEASNSGSIDLEWAGAAENIYVSFSGGNWSYDTGLESGELKILPLEAGTYHIEILGDCGETVSTDVEVQQLDELAITGAYPIDICFGEASNSGSIDLEWAGAAENIYVSFSGGNWSYDTGLESGELKILPLEAGTYHIEILGDCGETVSTDVEVQQLDELAITGAYPIDICFGEASNSGSIDLEWAGAAENIYVSFSGGNWSYDTGLESGELKILPLEAGTYHIEILGDCGETVSTDVEVQQLDELAITGAYPIDICFGEASNSGSIDLEWAGAAENIYVSFSGGNWSYDTGLESGELKILPLEAGTYHIEILGDCGETVSTDVEIKQLDELAITGAYPNDICFGGATNSGYIDLEWAGAAENISVSFPGGNWTYGTGLESGQLKILPLEAGTYHIEILDVCGETVSTDVEIKQLDELTLVDAEPFDVCFGAGDSTGRVNLEWTGEVYFIGVLSTYPDGGTGSRTIQNGLDNGYTTINYLPVGTHEIIIHGICSESVSTTVEIKQLEPVITLPQITTVYVSSGSTFILPDYIANGELIATNGCLENLTLLQSIAAGTGLSVGVHTITFTTQNTVGEVKNYSFDLTVEETLSINDSDINLEGVLIYPNPAKDKVTIKNSKGQNLKSAQLYDLRGRLVKKINLINMGSTFNLDLTSLEEAMYILKVTGENGEKDFKLMISK